MGSNCYSANTRYRFERKRTNVCCLLFGVRSVDKHRLPASLFPFQANMAPRPMSTFTIHTSLLFDPKKKDFVTDTSITVDKTTGLITEVYHRESTLPSHVSLSNVDLRGGVVLPGFVDAHMHIFLHAYSEMPSLNQMLDESLVERVIHAVNHCRTAFWQGIQHTATLALKDCKTPITMREMPSIAV